MTTDNPLPTLDELRELLAKATPRPWAWATDEGAPVYVQLYATDEAVDEYEADVLSSDARGVLVTEPNAALIVALRNAADDLLTRLATAEAQRDRYREALMQIGVEYGKNG